MQPKLREGFPHREDNPSVATYVGSGVLSIKGGGRIQCRFRADQEADGSIQIVFSSISPIDFVHHLIPVVSGGINAAFRGTTDDGIPITAKCAGGRPLALAPDGNATIYFPLRALKTYPAITIDSECHFLITNFAFSPFTELGEPPHQPPSHVFSLDVGEERTAIEIKPLDDYVERIIRLQQTRKVLPTASLVLRTNSTMPVRWYHHLATHLCILISVAAGTAVEWIAADGFDPEVNKHYRFHLAGVAKPFCSLPTIPIKEISYTASTNILRDFLQATLKQLSQADERQLASMIAAFLDARLEGEFLQTRGIKLAVTLEIIKNAFVTRFLKEEWNSAMPSDLRKKLVRITSAALKAEGFDDETIKMSAEALKQLSRPPLRLLIEYVIRVLRLNFDKTVVDAVVPIRNQLIHTGEFISDAKPAKAQELKIADVTQEFYLLLSFVDRLLLGALGHVGPYIDYSTSDKGQIRSRITGFRA
jgi:hypothetical protein